VVKLGEEFAPHRAFSLEAIPGGVPTGTNTIQVEISKNASAVQTDSTDYEANVGSNNDNAAITVNEYSVSWVITSPEQLEGQRFATGPGRNAQALSEKIYGVVNALLQASTFTNTVATVAEASFAAANRQALWASINAGTEPIHLVLTREAMSSMLPSDKNSFQLSTEGAYGFEGIHANSYVTGMETNAYGYACTPQAMVVHHGIPDRPAAVRDAINNSGRIETLQIPGGLEVELAVWTDTKTRSLFASLAICYGIAVSDPGALTLQESA
ncbi:MAG: hypothetical protein KAJ19_29690, partial [Gammaproteobacteria bacterium]|nr:hypothetical protein [Gammaproteobacteria bacterium]